MYILSPISNVEFSIPNISNSVSLSSHIAITIIPVLPRTVVDFERDLKSKTYAYSSYFLSWVCPISKIKHLKFMNSRQLLLVFSQVFLRELTFSIQK